MRGSASFKGAKGHLSANRCELHGTLDLAGADCAALTAEALIAHAATRIGPCSIGYVHLPRATFGSRVHIDLVASNVNIAGAVFEEGGLLVIDKATIQLEQVSLGGPLRISGKEGDPQPYVESLLNADAGQMSFANVNFARC